MDRYCLTVSTFANTSFYYELRSIFKGGCRYSQKSAPFWVLGFTAGDAFTRGKAAVVSGSQKSAPFWVLGFTTGNAFSRDKAGVVAGSQKSAPFWVLGFAAGCYAC